MIVNDTCVLGNDTSSCRASGSPPGLAAGLTVFFLLLVIIAGVIIYKYHREIRNVLQIGHRRSRKKEDYTETPEPTAHQYVSMSREQSTGQTPIYENLTTRTSGHNRRTEKQSRSPGLPEEDLYLQCDLPDDAIYSNDPVCNLSILPDSQEEEDLYIVPDS